MNCGNLVSCVNSLMVPSIFFSLELPVKVVVEVGTVVVGVVVKILKIQSLLTSLFAGGATAGGLLHPL